MKNFLRVVRLTLRRRYTFAAAVLCSLGVAALWGANLGLIMPIVEIVFSEQAPHDFADAKVAAGQKKVADLKREIAALDAQIAQAAEKDQRPFRLGKASLGSKLYHAEQELAASAWLQPIVKNYLPNSSFATLAIFVGFLLAATFVKDALLVCQLMLVERLTQLALL